MGDEHGMRPSARNLLLVACVAALVAPLAAQSPERQRRRSPVVEVFQRSRNAVVNVSTTRIQRVRMLQHGSLWNDMFEFGRPLVRQQRVVSVGAGVVIHEAGYIVTNAHVVAQTSDIQVTFADKREMPAQVVSVDSEHDLAVLKIESDTPLPYIELGRSDDILVGETVIAIGNPRGLEHTVTAGIVSALNRHLQFSDEVVYRGLIQTDAAINPGNSGGPLLNVNAELIGINTAIRGDAQNVGFAIPVSHLWALLPHMLDIERRERVSFGLEISGPHADVQAVRTDSPAGKAGLRRGDRLTHFNDHRLRDGIDYYVRLLEQKPGTTIRLTYKRRDESRHADVTLEPAPPPDGSKLAAKLLGMELVTVPDRVRRRYDLPRNVGLMVQEVESGGPAHRSEIVPGDLILRVEGSTVHSFEDLGLLLERVKPNERLIIEGFDTSTSERWYAWVRAAR
jgi:serine protease Do